MLIVAILARRPRRPKNRKQFKLKKMKKIATLLAAAMLLSGTSAFAQAYIGAGYVNSSDRTTVGNNLSTTATNGFYAGVGYTLPLSGGLSVTPGLTYMMLLSSGADSFGPLGLKGDLQEHYLNIPVHLNYGAELAPGVRGFVYAGPTVSLGLASSTKLTASIAGFSADKTFDNYADGSDYGRADVMLGGGIGVDFNSLRFTVGYDCGMLNRYTAGNTNTTRHRNQLTAGVAFLF